MPQLNILVVDDDRDVCEYLEDFLTSEGYGVRVMSDPTEVLPALKQEDFHVCVLDLMMPKLNGIDLLGQIRQVDDDIAVIILTGYPSLETATSSIEHNVSAYIRKPFSINEFREALHRIAKQKGLILRREDELHAAIGRCIRELRKSRGLTLKQMSRRTNLSVSLLSQIERAESSASVSSLFKVATALDVKITDLFGDF
ncbi:MAG: response regulator [Deltaproteobacteria bacterium]|nr:MAG: response regulator [Deltaproteobacteria bacterium]